MFPLIPAALVALTGAAYYKVSTSKHGIMTPERQQIYDAALTHLKDPFKLRRLAERFDSEGLSAYGDVLRKRADIRELPPNVRAARRDAYTKAMESTNVEAMEQIAIGFDRVGANGAAASIRNQIAIVKARPPITVEEKQEVLEELGITPNPVINEEPVNPVINEEPSNPVINEEVKASEPVVTDIESPKEETKTEEPEVINTAGESISEENEDGRDRSSSEGNS